MRAAAALVRAARRPLIVAGGGVIYSEATGALRALADATGIPVAETQAGKGAMPYDHPGALGAIGATGTRAANVVARDADLVIAVGTPLGDFTTASRTAFQDPGLRLVAVNVAAFDAHKLGALPLVGDARAGLEALAAALAGHRVDPQHAELAASLNREWDAEVGRLYAGEPGGPVDQAQVIGVVNDSSQPRDVVVCAAGSMPGDLHKLWRTRDPKGYHVEYGYSCMGYEVAGGLGVKLADPDREVIVMVGDGSWLMMSSEIATSIQEGARLTVVLIDNHGFGSIGGLSRSLGSEGFGTAYPNAGRPGRERAQPGRPRGAGRDDRTADRGACRCAWSRPHHRDRDRVRRRRAGSARTSRGGTCRWRRSRPCRPSSGHAPSTSASGPASVTSRAAAMTERLRVGVVGAGMIAQVEHIPNLLYLSPLYDLVGVADPSRGRAGGHPRAPRSATAMPPRPSSSPSRSTRSSSRCPTRSMPRPCSMRWPPGCTSSARSRCASPRPRRLPSPRRATGPAASSRSAT